MRAGEFVFIAAAAGRVAGIRLKADTSRLSKSELAICSSKISISIIRIT